MLLLASALIKEDCSRRGWEDKGLALSVGSLLLPVLGPCLYVPLGPTASGGIAWVVGVEGLSEP